MVKVECPYCRRRYRTELMAFGRIAVCSKCRQSFKIGESRPKFEWKTRDIAEDSWIGVPPPVEKEEIQHCIICDAPLRQHTIRCPECGANQITGVVQRARTVEEPSAKRFVIPWTLIGIVTAVVLLAIGGLTFVRYMQRTASQLAEDATGIRMVNEAKRLLRQGIDEQEFASQFGDQVTDSNLPRFVQMLAAGSSENREVASRMIGYGKIANLSPLMAALDDAKSGEVARQTLIRMGARRLAELSCSPEPLGARSAAQALIAIMNLPAGCLEELSKAVAVQEKIQTLNQLCRPWPEASGRFVIHMGPTTSPFTVEIEQVGKWFYLDAFGKSIVSVPNQRVFEMDASQWCQVTGAELSLSELSKLVGGSIRLASDLGVGWEGTLRIVNKNKPDMQWPGFVPLPDAKPGEVVESPVALVRPER